MRSRTTSPRSWTPAGERNDLLAQSVGLSVEAWPADDLVAAALLALDLPDVDQWLEVARERRGTGSHTAEGFASRTVDLPGVRLFRPGELPGF